MPYFSCQDNFADGTQIDNTVDLVYLRDRAKLNGSTKGDLFTTCMYKVDIRMHAKK